MKASTGSHGNATGVQSSLSFKERPNESQTE
jgi:hypothetical protein